MSHDATYQPPGGLRALHAPGTPALVGVRMGLVFGLIFLAATIPSSRVYIVGLPPFYGCLFDVIVVCLGVVAIPLALGGVLRLSSGTTVLASGGLAVLAIAGIWNSPFLEGHGMLCLTWPAAVLLTVPYGALLLLRMTGLPADRLLELLARFIAVLAAIYLLAAVVGPMLGLRSEIDRQTRIGGPLGNAAMLHIVFLPALAALLEQFRPSATRWLAASVCLAALVCMFSRAAAVCLVAYLAYFLVFRLRVSPWRVILATVLCLTVTWLVLRRAPEDVVARLFTLEANYRVETIRTSWLAWCDRPLLGHGFSRIWPFWQRSGELAAGLRWNRWDGLMISTYYGPSLWHPHNLVFYFGAEMGLLGLALLSLLFGPLYRVCLRRSRWRGVAVALLISLAVDCLTGGSFVAFPVACLVWWMFLLLVCQANEAAATPPRDSSRFRSHALAGGRGL